MSGGLDRCMEAARTHKLGANYAAILLDGLHRLPKVYVCGGARVWE